MPILISRNSGEPLYLQVKNQIERLVRLGIWERGRRLPAERQLATALGISRNTVSTAYRVLERDGLLLSRQGSGTFVAGIEDGIARDDALGSMLDLMLDEAQALGYGSWEMLKIMQDRIEQRELLLSKLHVAFVECNREQLDYFTRELELGSGVSIRRVLLDDLRRDHEAVRQNLVNVDLVVTTLFHLEEVQGFLAEHDVLGIALDPDMETMVTIARVPPGSRVGLVCISANFAERVKRSLVGAGMGVDLIATTTTDADQLRAFLRGVDVVVASPGRRNECEQLGNRLQVIEFVYKPDAGSINMLRSVLTDRARDAQRRQGRGDSVGTSEVGAG